jgi:hypothetical protein
MNTALGKLLPKQRRGSKPRCHFLTHGSPAQVAERLNELIQPWGSVSPTDRWMPQGFDDLHEPQLDKAPRLLDAAAGDALGAWWLAVPSIKSMTPNWDIASTCRINGRKGLLLIEAKAHDQELINEEGGKKLKVSATKNSKQNHHRIGECIHAASLSLTKQTGLTWALSRDRNYQMSNRFVWAWKLTEAGLPVILVYLGFLNADEMGDKGKPFHAISEWEQLVKSHSSNLVPPEVWNHQWKLHAQPFIPLICGIEQPLGKE